MNAVVKDQNLSPVQVTLLTKAMLSVAMCDGLHPAEAGLISNFYEGSRGDDMPTMQAMLDAVKASPLKVGELSGSAPEFAETVMLMCLMTAYADGSFSASERDYVKSLAAVLGIDDARFSGYLAQVHNELIGALSNLPDSASVAKVFGKLSSDI